MVKIDKWEVSSQYPDGHFVRSIGPIGSIEARIDRMEYMLHYIIMGVATCTCTCGYEET